MATPDTTVPVPLTLVLWEPERIGSFACPSCGEAMDVHQPESSDPERMLATCGSCGAWSLLDLLPGGRHVVMARLPDGDYFRRAIGG